jgi:hypothetical protein
MDQVLERAMERPIAPAREKAAEGRPEKGESAHYAH